MNITRTSTIAAIIVLAALSRFLPHPFNFTPIAAIALFGGAYFSNRWLAIIIPLAAMLISDTMHELFTGHGFHSGMPIIYGSFMLVSILGMIESCRSFRSLNCVSGSNILIESTSLPNNSMR